MSGPDVIRHAVRLLIVDDRERVLLLHYLTPDTGEDFWCTPGGALDGDETEIDAARREASEELGIDIAEVGAAVTSRVHRFRIGDGRLFEQHERFFLVRTGAFEPSLLGLGDFEREAVAGHRWWSLDELRERGAVVIQPPWIDSLVASVLHPGVPPVGIEPTSAG